MIHATKFGVVALCLLVGCTPLAETGTPVEPAPLHSSQSLTPAQADALMAKVVEAINRGDGESLLPYLLQRDQQKENVTAAINDFKTYFRGQPIQRFERQRVEALGQVANQPVQRFYYRLYGADGSQKETTVYQDQAGIRLTDEFFLYSYWAKLRAGQYLEAIQAKDAAHLAKLMSTEEKAYPVNQAAQTIAIYQAKFDLPSLQSQFTRLDPIAHQFVYTFSGAKAGQAVEHPIQVVYGDGLVQVKDSLLL
ncbi:MAG TPA: hypothetical protein V6D10_20780 [Trichocoleus sp.]|jgi:hypothetical protein